jgi:hypothetical protein
LVIPFFSLFLSVFLCLLKQSPDKRHPARPNPISTSVIVAVVLQSRRRNSIIVAVINNYAWNKLDTSIPGVKHPTAARLPGVVLFLGLKSSHDTHSGKEDRNTSIHVKSETSTQLDAGQDTMVHVEIAVVFFVYINVHM